MKIDRVERLNMLRGFAQEGSGLIIGRPGVGKTYLVSELSKILEQDNVPTLQIAVDMLGEASDTEIREALELPKNLVPFLQEETNRGILIIDGYDAARNEAAQRNILSLIRESRQKLPHWNVLVVVRTYDAQKSPELADLFPPGSPKAESSPVVQCRHLVIPALNDVEIRTLQDNAAELLSIYASASPQLKELLQVPFNLWLLERLKRGSAMEDLTGVTSQVQLLRMFWQRRVTAGNSGPRREVVLMNITRRMVEERSLSARKQEVIDPSLVEDWHDLLSTEVLVEHELGSRIRFAHNIFFDFAVSALLLDDNANSLINFLQADQSRQLFLRPSLVFYFARLWHEQPTTFWSTYHTLLTHTGTAIRLVGRMIPPSVLISECDNRGSLDPLVKAHNSDPSVGGKAVRYVLRALRTWPPRSLAPWEEFLKDLAATLSSEIAWEVALVVDILLPESRQMHRAMLASAARSTLAWTWKARDSSSRELADAILGRFGVPQVAKTFGTDPAASRAVLQPVLSLVKEPGFPIQPIYELCANLVGIAATDPAFVREVYRTVYAEEETSDAKTQMGGSTVLVMTSTRRQDFEMCFYLLLQYFPQYLRTAFLEAIRAAIESVNLIVRRKHLREAHNADQFVFRGRSTTYEEDGSFAWGASLEPYDPVSLLDHVRTRVEELLSQDGQTEEIAAMLDVFRDYARVAYCWKQLLIIVAKHPAALRDVAIELCIAPPILRGHDTQYEAAEVINALSPTLTPDEMGRLEKAILDITPEYVRRRFLSVLPKDKIITPEAKGERAALEQAKQTVPNTPIMQFHFSTREYSADEWLKDHGVDLELPGNKRMRELDAILSSAITNVAKPVTAEHVEVARQAAASLRSAIEKEQTANDRVKEGAWLSLAQFARFALTHADDENMPASVLAREILIACATSPSPAPSHDADATFTTPAWSPSPRTEAAQLLPIWFARTGEETPLDLFMALLHDPVPAVRFLAAHEVWRIRERAPTAFWSAIHTRIDREVNDTVLQGIVDSIGKVLARDEAAGVEALARVRERARARTAPAQLLDLFSSMMTWLVIDQQNADAATYLEELIRDPVTYSRALQRAAFDVRGFIAGPADGADVDAAGQRAVEWLIHIVDGVQHGLTTLKHVSGEDGEDSPRAELYRSIDSIVIGIWLNRSINKPTARAALYWRVKPLLVRVVAFAMTPDIGGFASSTAHHAMEYLSTVVSIDPSGVLQLASEITSRSPNYRFDSLAIAEVVKLVEIILADHREILREPESLEHLLSLLDIFAETGWGEAVRLVWRLDEIFR
jgi:hypothetical protein